LYRVIRDRQVALPDDTELLAELKSVRLRESGVGQFRLDHDQGQHDDQAVAVGLLAVTLLEPRRRRRGVVSIADREVIEATAGEHPSTHGSGSGIYAEHESLIKTQRSWLPR
jgi:hypothetical protein